jgi:hypothetical protein
MKSKSTMVMCIRRIPAFVIVASLIPHPSSLARADGGAVRLSERAGAYKVTVFTSPTPFRAGTVDVSMLIQDATTGECVPEARVHVRLTARATGDVLDCPATAEAATNKLFHAAVFQLPDPGWWDVEVGLEGPHGPAWLRFEIQAQPALPRWLEFWPWFTWPGFAVALFGLHQLLVRRRTCLRSAISEPRPLGSGGTGPLPDGRSSDKAC